MEPQTLVLICAQISSTKLISLRSTDVLCHTRIWKRNDLKSQEKKISTEEDCRTGRLMVTRSGHVRLTRVTQSAFWTHLDCESFWLMGIWVSEEQCLHEAVYSM